LVRSFLPLPPLIEKLLSLADSRLGAGTAERFVARFNATGYGNELRKPMLDGSGVWRTSPPPGSNPACLGGLRIVNLAQSAAEVIFAADFASASVESLFDSFVRSTAHSNPVGDFRNHPERYAPILAGPRYVAFHGDGHCFVLANMLSALLRRLTGTQTVVRHTVTGDGDFIHTFVEWRAEGGHTMLDADQKTACAWDAVGPPYGMIYQILSQAGAMVYESIPEAERRWLFCAPTRAFFANFHGDPDAAPPRIYQSSPAPEILSDLFMKAKAHRLEAVSLAADDYRWKARFRVAMQGHELLSQFERSLRLVLPPGGSMTLGHDDAWLPDRVGLLSLVFFGRVPATLRADIPQNGRLALTLPERPWLIAFSQPVTEASINRHRLATHRCGDFSVLGAGDFDEFIGEPGIAGNAPCVIEGPPGTTVSIILPFNALAFNAGTMRIVSEASTSYRYA
jgi:hypothetical protein